MFLVAIATFFCSSIASHILDEGHGGFLAAFEDRQTDLTLLVDLVAIGAGYVVATSSFLVSLV